MANEIINKLGLDVAQALTSLRQLDNQLQTSGTAWQTHAGQLTAWNTQAQTALATMRAMARISGKPGKTPAAVAPLPAVAQIPGLPPGMQGQVDKINQSMDALGRSSAAAGEKMTRAGRRGAKALDGANMSSTRLVMSFQMLARIVFTQAIVRALSQVRNLLRASVSESIKFQRAISEVLLITMAPLEGSMRETTSSFQTLTEEAANMARRFNVDLGQAVEGMYQTISNQFTEVTERTQIMEASMKLARVGVIDLKDSVLLMTGSLNAYGLSSQNADQVAAQFFRTIQLGRVRGKELADTLGTVIPIAAQLGITLDEVTAAYVSLTIGGIEAHKASTGLRQSMLAFLKPSEDMKKILRELGYANAEQIVQALGFVGALEAISDASQNMASEYAKSVRRVRALTASLALTRNDAGAYKDAVKAMSQSSAEHLDELWEKFKEMPAEKLTHEINKLKVTLTQDLGMTLTQVLGSIMEWVGGASRLIAVLKALTGVVVVLGGAFAALAVQALLAHAALGPLGLALLAVSALVAVIIYDSAAEVAKIREVAEARRASTDELLRATRALHQAQRKEAADTLREQIRVWEQGVAEIRRKYYKVIDDLKIKNRELVDNTRETLSLMVKAQERVVAAYRTAAKAAADAVQASRERQSAAEAAYSDAVFKYSNKNARAYQKAEKYMQRASFLAREADEAMRSARTPEEIASALAIFQRAEAAAQEAENIAGGTKNTLLQADAQRAILFLMRQKIEAEKELQKIQAEEAQRLARQAAAEAARLSRMKILMKGILEGLQVFDKTGPKDPKALAGQQKQLQQSLDLLRTEWLEGPGVDVSEMFAFDKLQQRVQLALEGGVTKAQVKKLDLVPGTFAEMRTDIEKGVGPMRVLLDLVIPKLPPRIQEMVKGLSAEQTLSVFSSEFGKTTDILNEFSEMSAAAAEANQQMLVRQKHARASLEEWWASGEHQEDIVQTGFDDRWKPIYTVRDASAKFQQAAQKFTTLAPEDLNVSEFAALKTAYDAYLEKIKPPTEARNLLKRFMDEAALATSHANTEARLIGGIEEEGGMRDRAAAAMDLGLLLEGALQKAQAIQAAQDAAKESARQVREQAAGARGEVTAVSQIDMTSLTTQIGTAADNMWDLAYASMSVQAPGVGELSARGGRVGRYLAAGGPVGTDVVPAWLSRGEFVMNAQASGQFASQLVAMNAGVQPTFRSEGGSVTNVGDINVSVEGGATGRQTARSIAAELRREMRRGTI